MGRALEIPPIWKSTSTNLIENRILDFSKFDVMEDMFQTKYQDYLLDIGFYGKNKKSGSYKLFVIKGDFINGILIESFESSAIDLIIKKTEFYLKNIPLGNYNQHREPKIVDGLINDEPF